MPLGLELDASDDRVGPEYPREGSERLSTLSVFVGPPDEPRDVEGSDARLVVVVLFEKSSSLSATLQAVAKSWSQ